MRRRTIIGGGGKLVEYTVYSNQGTPDVYFNDVYVGTIGYATSKLIVKYKKTNDIKVTLTNVQSKPDSFVSVTNEIKNAYFYLSDNRGIKYEPGETIDIINSPAIDRYVPFKSIIKKLELITTSMYIRYTNVTEAIMNSNTIYINYRTTSYYKDQIEDITNKENTENRMVSSTNNPTFITLDNTPTHTVVRKNLAGRGVPCEVTISLSGFNKGSVFNIV